jgi:hypothetical protein
MFDLGWNSQTTGALFYIGWLGSVAVQPAGDVESVYTFEPLESVYTVELTSSNYAVVALSSSYELSATQSQLQIDPLQAACLLECTESVVQLDPLSNIHSVSVLASNPLNVTIKESDSRSVVHDNAVTVSYTESN